MLLLYIYNIKFSFFILASEIVKIVISNSIEEIANAEDLINQSAATSAADNQAEQELVLDSDRLREDDLTTETNNQVLDDIEQCHPEMQVSEAIQNEGDNAMKKTDEEPSFFEASSNQNEPKIPETNPTAQIGKLTFFFLFN